MASEFGHCRYAGSEGLQGSMPRTISGKGRCSDCENSSPVATAPAPLIVVGDHATIHLPMVDGGGGEGNHLVSEDKRNLDQATALPWIGSNANSRVGTVEMDSADLGWSGVRVIRMLDPAESDPFDVVTGDYLSIVLIRSAAEPKNAFNIERLRNGRWSGARYRSGDLGMTAPEQSVSIRWSNRTPHTTVHASLSASLLDEAADDAGVGLPTHRLNRLCLHEPTVRAIVLALEHASETDSGRFYADSAAHFLAAHLVAAPELNGMPTITGDGVKLTRMDEFLHQHLCETFTLAELARAVGIGTFQLIRLCRATYGETPFKRLTRFRLERARELLQAGGLSVTQVAFDCGYSSSSAFGSAFLRSTGMSPREYRAL